MPSPVFLATNFANGFWQILLVNRLVVYFFASENSNLRQKLRMAASLYLAAARQSIIYWHSRSKKVALNLVCQHTSCPAIPRAIPWKANAWLETWFLVPPGRHFALWALSHGSHEPSQLVVRNVRTHQVPEITMAYRKTEEDDIKHFWLWGVKERSALGIWSQQPPNRFLLPSHIHFTKHPPSFFVNPAAKNHFQNLVRVYLDVLQ